MSRPSQAHEQRRNLLPIVCQTFRDLGYRRTTTAELARRCGVRVNILYRLWPDKKAMFLAAIDDIFQSRAEKWRELMADLSDPARRVERLIAYETQHQSEFGYYRVIFTALAETDDDEMRKTLIQMYRQFHKLVVQQISTGREIHPNGPPVSDAAWGLIGLATISNIIVELNLLGPRQREQMFAAVAKSLVGDRV
ncbi:MAG: TetR/AcrR family transcriptional regulator [Planctomyces sp.]|nr:TetR/AcrR family transcriptional regulator [Planctomyces sp.]